MGSFILPDKWKIRITNDNYEFLESKRLYGFDARYTDFDNDELSYLISVLIDKNKKNSWYYQNIENLIINEYTEITLNQFKEYVLNEPVEPIESQNYDYLIELFEELNIK